MLARSAFDGSHVRSVTAWALTHPDHPGIAGRIVANWSDNPNGSVCTATVAVFTGPLAFIPNTTGNAGGGGYCKFSAAVCDALWRARESSATIGHLDQAEREKLDTLDGLTFNGAGESAVCAWFEKHGYQVVRVIG
jgi:hypothetical protein